MRMYLMFAIALFFSVTNAHDNDHDNYNKHNPPPIDLNNVKLEPILSERTYSAPLRGHFKKTESFSVSNLQATDQFLIRLVNADGKPHTIEKCSGSFISRLKCLADNLIDKAYINIFRVKEAQLVLNGKKIVEADLFNKHTAKYEAFIKLNASNELKIDFEGSPKSYMSIAIYRLVKDIVPPVIQASIGSGIYTNQRAVGITIDELSNVSSEVYINNNLVLTSTQKSFSFNLVNGLNQIEIRSKDQYGNTAVPLVISNVTFDDVAPILSLTSADTTFYTNSFPKTVSIQVSSNEALKSLKVNSQDVILNANNLANVDIQLTQAGALNIEAVGIDLAGNSSTQAFVLNAILDTTAPIITFGLAPNTLTNQSLISVPIAITEDNDVHSQILVNGEDVLRTSAKNFNFEAELKLEGENQIQVISTDIAGNVTQSSILKIVKDQMPPVLSNIQPQNNKRIDRLVFVVSGHSNEPLQEVSVNGLVLALDNTKTNFSGNYVAAQNGTENLNFTAKDLAGNITNLSSSVQIDNRLLIPELVSIVPNADRVHLNIVGAAGSARSGVEISASSGLLGFNFDSSTSSSDGSFILKLSPFTSATLKAKDSQNSEEVSITLNYQISTRLSGVVKDTQGNPLPGATISISSFNETVLTDSSGVFNINRPATGDQTLTVDGSTIPQSVTGVNRKFSSTKIQINIGLGQQNVIDRPIYLAPLILDGTETIIQAGQDATVTSPQAPGVQLEIAADIAVFPTGSENKINIASIESSKATVPVPQNAIPQNVIALEPSGLKFQERVPVILPNENELPPGVEMFILSMDSSNGTWSVDGKAVVSADGQTIKTKDGEGISHFSLIYAIPAKPVLAAVDNPKLGGIDISQGSLTTSVSLPSWKSLGASITPNLIYKSNWANPTAYVSNYIDVPKQEYTFSYKVENNTSSIEAIKGRYCETYLGITFRCHNTYDEYIMSVESRSSIDFTSWYQPDSIRSQFFIGNLTSGPIQFVDNTTEDFSKPDANLSKILPGPIVAGGFGSNIVNYTGIPNRSMVSYAVPLKNNSSGEYLSSGIYPSLTRFEVRLKHLTITTTSNYLAYSTKFVDDKFKDFNQSNVVILDKTITTKEAKLLDQVFPSDILSPLLVQNKVKSSAGRGWHLGLTQTILNPEGNKILLEEESGELSTYSINNTISTVYNAANTGVDIESAFDFSQWPKIVGLYRDSSNDNYFVELNLSQNSPSPVSLGKLTQFTGNYGYSSWFSGLCNATPNSTAPISDYVYEYKTQTNPSSILRSSNGTFYATSQRDHTLFQITSGVQSFLIQKPVGPFASNVDNKTQEQIDSQCLSVSGALCEKKVFRTYSCNTPGDPDFPIALEFLRPKGSVRLGQPGSVQGEFTNLYTSTLAQAGLNNPQGMIMSPDGFLVIADTGNNMVRKIDITNNQVSTIAGDGSNFDVLEGMPPILTSIFHPVSVAYDDNKNLYILSEKGYIRKIDTQGNISHFAGLPPEQGGILSNEAVPMKQIALIQPSSMIFDSANNFLYVADTKNHRVVRFDLNTEMASTVAGNGTCDLATVKDNVPALESSLCKPKYIGLDNNNNLLVVDADHKRIRKINFNFSTTGTLAYDPGSKDGSHLYRYSDGTWSRKLRAGTVIYYNAEGKQTKAVNRLGKEILYDYDSSKNLTQITDVVGQKTYLNYSGGLLSSIVDPAGRTTSFNYNFGNLISVNFPDGNSKIFEYNSDGLMTKEINQRGYSKKYVYNEFNRLASVTDEMENTTQINDVITGSMSNSYTGGNVGSLNNQGTGPTQLHDRVVDAKNIETELTKDFNGLISKIKDGKGQITSIERDLEGLTKKIVFPDNSEVTMEYDPITKDLLKTTDNGTGISESQTYNQYGQVISMTDSKGFTYSKQYDISNGLLLQELSPNLQLIIYQYNSFGLPTAIIRSPTSSVSLITSVEYDSRGNKSKMIYSDGKSVSFLYDSAGNLIQKNIQITSSLQEVTRYQFDIFNRLTKVISPKNESTEYTYFPTGQLASIKDPLNNETFFEYTKKGLLAKKTEPDNKIYTFTHDANGNLISETDPNGVTKFYTVDELNQITKITLPDDEYHFTYSVRGDVLIAANNAATITQNYDTKGRLTASLITASSSVGSYPTIPISYSYDKNSNRETLRSDVLNLDYFYDQSNRLRQINNGNGSSFLFDFDSANRLIKITRPGSNTDLSYSSENVLSSIKHSNSNGILEQNIYSRDQRNTPTQKRTLAGNFEYAYDLNGQLTASTSPAISESFSYDDIGNRISDENGIYSYSSSRQLIEQDYNYTYTHDNKGNMIGKFSKLPTGDKYNYTYTSLNQLKEIKIYAQDNSLKKTIKYYFDPKGRRISKSIIDHLNSLKSYTRFFIYDGENIISEHDASGNRLASYTHSTISSDDILEADITSPGQEAKLSQSSGKFYYLKDHLGSVDVITDNLGNVVQKYQYSSFGKILNITNNQFIKTSFTYTGREFDEESGLYFYRARSYDAYTGRFLQQDPDPGKLMSPITIINKFAYVSNNPVVLNDPTGKTYGTDPGDTDPTDVHGHYCGYSAQGQPHEWYSDQSQPYTIQEPEDQLDFLCMEHDTAYATYADVGRIEQYGARVRSDVNLILGGLGGTLFQGKGLAGIEVAVGGAAYLTFELTYNLNFNILHSIGNSLGIKNLFGLNW